MSKVKRVLIVTPCFNRGIERDGVSYTFKALVKEFYSSDIKFDLLYYGPEDKIIKEGNITFYQYKIKLPWKLYPHLSIETISPSLIKIYNILKKNKYSIVSSSTPCSLGWIAYFISKESKCPFITIYHTMLNNYSEIMLKKISLKYKNLISLAHKFFKTYFKNYFNKSDLILCPSNSIKKFLLKNYNAPVRIMSRGIDTKAFRPKKDKKISQSITVLFVSRISEEKNINMIIKVFSKLLKKNKKIKLKIAGDGPELIYLKDKLPDAEFSGWLTGEKYAKAFREANIFFFPSKTETFGNVVLQALSSGLPCIVSNKLAAQELVKQGKTGFICSSKKQYKEAILMLINSPKLRKRMSIAAVESAKEYSWKNVFDKLIQDYEYTYNKFQKQKKSH